MPHPKYLIVRCVKDRLADQVASLLAQRFGASSILSLQAWQLLQAKRWSQLQEQADVVNTLALGDKELDLRNLVVLNRLNYVEVPSFARSRPEEREYASAEIRAFGLSWLAAFPGPVINRPTHLGLAGAVHERLSWIALALQAGIPIGETRATSSLQRFPASGLAPDFPTVLDALGGIYSCPPAGELCRINVIGEQIIGQHPPALVPAIKGLARSVGADILELHLYRPDDPNKNWLFGHATTVPEHLPLEGEEALIRLLESKSGVFV